MWARRHSRVKGRPRCVLLAVLCAATLAVAGATEQPARPSPARTGPKAPPAGVDALVENAQAHLARGELEAAYDLLQRAVSLDARNADVLYFLAVASSELATRELNRLYALAPDGARVHQLMARSFKVQGRLVEAAAEYELALRASPDLLEVLLELAEIRRQESNCDEAARLYDRAEALKSTFDGSYGRAVCLAFDNDHSRAMDAFRQALKHDPGAAIAHFGLGSSLLRSGQTAAAVPPLQRAVSLEPRMRQGYYLLGRAYRAMGLHDRSQQAFARADALAQAERAGEPSKSPR